MSPRDFALIALEAYSAIPDVGSKSSASRAIIRDTDAGLCVAFPGTDNIDCWEADLKVLPINVPGIGRVHQGFWRAWTDIAVPVLAAINGRPVTFVGHSLGAAIAIMAGTYLTVNGNPPVAVYGFEPPRISPDINIRTILTNVPVHLYKNGLDIVPDLPLGWYHAALVVGIGKPSLPIPNVKDHSMVNVLAALA